MGRFSKSDRAQNLPRRTQRRKKNGYIVFYMAMLQNYPSCAVKSVAQRAGQLWNSMSPCEKELYKERARHRVSRTCRGCHEGVTSTPRHREQDGLLATGRPRCVRDSTPFSLRPPAPRAPLDPYFYLHSGGQEPGVEPDARTRYRYVSTSEHCGCRRAQTPGSRGGVKKVPATPTEQQRGCGCGKKPQSPATPPGAVVKRRCRCGAEFEVPVEERCGAKTRACRCGKDHSAAPPAKDERSGAPPRCHCGRWDCKSRGGREEAPSRMEHKRAADRATPATFTGKKRHYSAWYT